MNYSLFLFSYDEEGDKRELQGDVGNQDKQFQNRAQVKII